MAQCRTTLQGHPSSRTYHGVDWSLPRDESRVSTFPSAQFYFPTAFHRCWFQAYSLYNMLHTKPFLSVCFPGKPTWDGIRSGIEKTDAWMEFGGEPHASWQAMRTPTLVVCGMSLTLGSSAIVKTLLVVSQDGTQVKMNAEFGTAYRFWTNMGVILSVRTLWLNGWLLLSSVNILEKKFFFNKMLRMITQQLKVKF